ncbi:phage tail assembly chaperone [Chenggangzhangella methanolivorans]|uniref:phage tail assembly chaperone n=1 Tax=Chenggangzhangella methanolivorans TaxID=1437009 RepID=UPI0028F3F336|nr:phage tail assembly chaperone [Chenggangzhangella methanolivorans]
MLKLAPRDFWRATPAEIAAAARGLAGAAGAVAPLRRGELERLMTTFPDAETRHG